MRKIILMMMLTIAGCGDRGSADKAVSDAAPAHNKSLNSQFGAGPQAPEKRFAETKQKAESGLAKDQLGLAKLYNNGDGVAKDDVKAAEWYQKAAEQGIAFAQYKLGAMYDKGEGVPKDAAKAVEWWEKAAAQGNGAAQESLKHLSANGK
ncbi:MAG: tetratricopeptide repeat protein [Gallionella sp.]